MSSRSLFSGFESVRNWQMSSSNNNNNKVVTPKALPHGPIIEGGPPSPPAANSATSHPSSTFIVHKTVVSSSERRTSRSPPLTSSTTAASSKRLSGPKSHSRGSQKQRSASLDAMSRKQGGSHNNMSQPGRPHTNGIGVNGNNGSFSNNGGAKQFLDGPESFTFRDEVVSPSTSPEELHAAVVLARQQRDSLVKLYLHQRASAEACYKKWMASEQRHQDSLMRMINQSSMLQESGNLIRKLKEKTGSPGASVDVSQAAECISNIELQQRCQRLQEELENSKDSHKALSQALVDLSVSFNERMRLFHQKKMCALCEHDKVPSDTVLWREKFEAAFLALQRNNELVFKMQKDQMSRHVSGTGVIVRHVDAHAGQKKK
eukprot:PhF_6_TR6322/c0_g1_i2/m.9582